MVFFNLYFFLFFVFSHIVVLCDARANYKKKKELKRLVKETEKTKREEFFRSYRKIQSDVHKLKLRNARQSYLSEKLNKQRLFQFGVHGYVDLADLFTFIKSRSGGTDGFVLTTRDEKKISELTPLIVGGGVIDINFSKYAGMSIILGYSLFKETQENKVTSFRSGYSGMLLFKLSNLNFPFSIFTSFIPNLLDPIFWILYLTKFYYKSEVLAGFIFSMWSNVNPGQFSFGVTDNSFKRIKKLWDNRSKTTVTEKIIRIVNEYMYFERRVYITKHIYYSLNSTLLIPMFISWVQTDCKQLCEWLKKNYMKFFLNVTLGFVI